MCVGNIARSNTRANETSFWNLDDCGCVTCFKMIGPYKRMYQELRAANDGYWGLRSWSKFDRNCEVVMNVKVMKRVVRF